MFASVQPKTRVMTKNTLVPYGVLACIVAVGVFPPLSATDAPQSASGMPQATTPAAEPSRTFDEVKSPMMRALSQLIDQVFVEQLADGKEGFLLQVREADRIYTRVKQDNKRGLWMANHPPQFRNR